MSFTPPDTLEDGEAMRAVLLSDISDIQVQLRTTDPDRRPDYDHWLRKARSALAHKQNEYRVLNTWLKARRAKEHSGRDWDLHRRTVTFLRTLSNERLGLAGKQLLADLEHHLPEWYRRENGL